MKDLTYHPFDWPLCSVVSALSVRDGFSRLIYILNFSTASLGPFDGKVAASIKDLVITTPNQSWIPFPPWGKRSLRLRADMHYADDDFTL